MLRRSLARLRSSGSFSAALGRVGGNRTPVAFFSSSISQQQGIVATSASAVEDSFHGDVEAIRKDDAAWAKAWKAAVSGLISDCPYDDSANQLRALIKTGLLRFTDLEENPERFFEAHREVAKLSVAHGPGFFIRFTVQYNLFAGTVIGMAADDQRATLEAINDSGELGCFGLTERLAGVSSGLVVETLAHWDKSSQEFVINTPTQGAAKNWISQGYTADKALVLANLIVDDKPVGANAFLADLRRDGALVPGVEIGDMGRKTVGNDLDNAWIHFTDFRLPKEALLRRFGTIENDEFVQLQSGVRVFDQIGQRLFSGRIAVAQAALEFQEGLFAATKEYSDARHCWTPGDGNGPSLSSLPQLEDVYTRANDDLIRMKTFVGACEEQLCEHLKARTLPDANLTEAIAVCKINAVETAIKHCFALKQEVGSYALMGGKGFEQTDFLQCCKFAEGDSRILMQKMARDRLKAFAKAGNTSDNDIEADLCARVGAAVAELGPEEGMRREWRTMYRIAENRMDVVMRNFL